MDNTLLNRFPWAKSNHETRQSLSLVHHSLDVAETSPFVADHFLSKAEQQKLSETLGIEIKSIVKFVSALHDIGKASTFFQQKDPNLYTQTKKAFNLPSNPNPFHYTNVYHSLISGWTLLKWFKQKEIPIKKTDLKHWFYILSGHHGTFQGQVLEHDDALLEPKEWHTLRLELIDFLLQQLNFTEKFFQRLPDLKWDNSIVAIITSCLIASDWIGSNESNFPYTEMPIENRGKRAQIGFEKSQLGAKYIPDNNPLDSFHTRFNLPDHYKPTPVQRGMVESVDMLQIPSLILLETQTGGGKTAAALMTADKLAKKFNKEGVFIAQPTQITSNAMFERVLTWLQHNQNLDTETTVSLAHGKAMFDETLTQLKTQPLAQIYDETSKSTGSIEAKSWFSGNKKNLLSSVSVGTIDQLLFSVLPSKHVVLRHLGLLNKVVIIDEIHASDDYMKVYLLRAFEWLGFYGVPVIALSATVSSEMRQELLEAYRYGSNRCKGEKRLSQEENTYINEEGIYPRITFANKDKVGRIHVESESRNQDTHVEFLEGDIDIIAKKIVNLAKEGGCVAGICGTVSRAQQLYEEVVQLEGSSENIVLLHSRFIASHRKTIEDSLVHCLGPDVSKRLQKLIVISTQILEQGLDLDFDTMVSDIAPVDLILQRMGRIHRHPIDQSKRPEAMNTPHLYITGVDFSQDIVTFPKGLLMVYRKYPLLRSVIALQTHLEKNDGVVSSPGDVASLIASSQDADINSLNVDTTWIEVLKKEEEKEQEYITKKRQKARKILLPKPTEKHVGKWSEIMQEANDESVQAQVRDTESNVEVIVVQQKGNHIYPLTVAKDLDANIPVDDIHCIPDSVAKSLATCTVRLPSYVVGDKEIVELEEKGYISAWQNTHWLKGMLPLILDEKGYASIGNTQVMYDESIGLVFCNKTPSTSGREDF